MQIIWAKDLAVVILVRTLTDDARLEFVQSSIGFDHRWKASVNLTVEGSDRYYIDALIDKNTENEWK